MSRAFQIIEVPQLHLDVEKYFEHKKEVDKMLKNIKKKDRKRKARNHFHSIY